MPDWRKILHRRLELLALPPERKAEVIEELARDLEESWSAAVAAGADEQEAIATTLEELGDSSLLERDITQAVAPSLLGKVSEACRTGERNAPCGTPGRGTKVTDFARGVIQPLPQDECLGYDVKAVCET